MKRIPLTRGLCAIVDDETYKWASQFNWFAHAARHTFYPGRTVWTGTRSVTVLLHRLVCGATEKQRVDHINRNGLDCRRRNLRFATIGQNNMNSRKRQFRRGVTSRWKGVSWHKCAKKWVAQIQVNRKPYILGYYADEVSAARSYDRAARRFHGRFAAVNFPRRGEVRAW